MQIHIPGPAYTSSDRARSNFRLAFKLALCFVALLWLVELLNWTLDLGVSDLGVRPRDIRGLPGIFVAPLVHASAEHLIANTVPLLVLGTAMLYLYPNAALRVLPMIYFGPGIAVWLFARGGTHVGASGIIYGLVSYIFVAGLIRRDRRAIAASLLVSFLYGASVWGFGVGHATYCTRDFVGNPFGSGIARIGNGDRAAQDGHPSPASLQLGG